MNVLVDLRPSFDPVRDQGPRPTCLACAVSDLHAFLRAPVEPLSAEYIFYRAAARRGGVPDPERGSTIQATFEALEIDGQPFERFWPYSKTPPRADAWTPPANTGQLFTAKFATGATCLNVITLSLRAGIPVLIGVKISTAFYRPPTTNLIEQAQPDLDTGNHAMIGVGLGESAGRTAILVRNSWGDTWADKGHVWLDESYLLPRLRLVGVGKKVSLGESHLGK